MTHEDQVKLMRNALFRLLGVSARLMDMIRSRFVVVILLIAAACAPQKPPSIERNQLVIAATSDFHSTLDRAEGLASAIRQLESVHSENMLFLDAGDQFQGSLEASLSKGEATVDFFNHIGLDAAAIGNHELDYGPAEKGRIRVLEGEDGLGNLKLRVKQAQYPWLSANMVQYPYQTCSSGDHCNATGKRTVFQPRTILNRGGYRIGIIGATTTSTPQITNPAFVRDVRFDELLPVVEAEAKHLRGSMNCDLVLLLIHEGFRRDSTGKYLTNFGLYPVLEKLSPGLVDAVIAGHSHIKVQEQVNGIYVLQSGLYGQVAGVMKISGVRPNLQIQFDPWIEIDPKAEQPDIAALLKPYRDQAAGIKQRLVGSSMSAFPTENRQESALGNMVADAILEDGKRMADAEFSLMNSGGLRNPLPEGSITYGDIFKVLPFENSLVVADLTGAELRSVLEIAFSGTLGMPAVSGLAVEKLNIPPGVEGPWDRDLNGDGIKETWERNLVRSVTDLNGSPISDSRNYRLATIDYLTNGGDYQGFVFNSVEPHRVKMFLERPIREIVVEYLTKNQKISAEMYLNPKRVQLTEPNP